MKFEELIKDPFFDLPLTQPCGMAFDKYIEEILNTFLRKIDELDDGELKVYNDIPSDKGLIKTTQAKIVNSLINCLKEYLNGYPHKAYNILDNLFTNEVKSFYGTFNLIGTGVPKNFYRIRLREDNQNKSYSPSNLFHIPFSDRGKVSSQRYSIPGFPSLYLSETLYVCWEELNRPDINKFEAVRLKAIKSLRLLDLSPPEEKTNKLTRDVFYHIMKWPLIACCSVKVYNPSDAFKPEYIIPQLLLQWVRSNDELDGIKYKSNHIEPTLYKQAGELYNIVLPVKGTAYDGHCSALKESFEVTEVISWQLYQLTLGGQTFLQSGKSPLDLKLPKLELIKGMSFPYSYSTLGKLEEQLDNMTTHKID
ncbi:MAG: RES domain-containing protein [Bacteroidota bacterium]|nr:RES domain-containing protein [Bacteroidota bacterium]